jgi:prophage DNA circulation protein
LQGLRDEFIRGTGANGGSDDWKIVSDFDDAIQNTSDLKDSKKLFDNIAAGFKLVERITPVADRFESFRRIANSSAKVSILSAKGGETENAVHATMRVLAASYMARAAVETPALTLGGSLDQLDRIMSVLEGEAEMAKLSCDHTLYLAIRNFSTETKSTLLSRAYTLPPVVSYDLARGVHSLVAAHEIYGDARRFGEIELRNPQYSPMVTGPFQAVA